MTHPDSGAISSAIVAALQADATLAALMPDGVWFGLAAPGLQRFVLVVLMHGTDEELFGQRAIEDRIYVVKAIGLSRVVTVANMKAAAHQIDVVLERATLAPAAFSWMDCVREEPIEDPVPDALDPSLAWHHYGGQYRIQVAWPDPVPAEE